MDHNRNTDLIDLLRKAGLALYGEQWQSEFARAFGLRDASRVREQLSGRRPVRVGLLLDAAAALREKAVKAIQVAEEIERAPDVIKTRSSYKERIEE